MPSHLRFDPVSLATEPALWAAAGIVIGLYMFFRGFGLLRRKLLIESVPQATVRSAALGLVEVSGTATGPYSVISPLSKTECYFYRAILPRHDDCQETLCVPFFLDDGTGRLLIDPRGAETDLQASFSEDVEWDSAPDYIRHFLSRHGVASGQVDEYCIRANDRLFVTGTLQDNPTIDQMSEDSGRCSPAGGLRYLSPEAADLQRELAFQRSREIARFGRILDPKTERVEREPSRAPHEVPIRRSFSDLLEQSAVYASRSGLLFRHLHLGWPNPNPQRSLHLADPIGLFIAATACTSLD